MEQQKFTGHKLNNAKLNQETLNLLKKDPRAHRGGLHRHSLQTIKQSHKMHTAACTLNPKVTTNKCCASPEDTLSRKEGRLPREKNGNSSMCSSSFRLCAGRGKLGFPSSHAAQHLCDSCMACQAYGQRWGLQAGVRMGHAHCTTAQRKLPKLQQSHNEAGHPCKSELL